MRRIICCAVAAAVLSVGLVTRASGQRKAGGGRSGPYARFAHLAEKGWELSAELRERMERDFNVTLEPGGIIPFLTSHFPHLMARLPAEMAEKWGFYVRVEGNMTIFRIIPVTTQKGGGPFFGGWGPYGPPEIGIPTGLIGEVLTIYGISQFFDLLLEAAIVEILVRYGWDEDTAKKEANFLTDKWNEFNLELGEDLGTQGLSCQISDACADVALVVNRWLEEALTGDGNYYRPGERCVTDRYMPCHPIAIGNSPDEYIIGRPGPGSCGPGYSDFSVPDGFVPDETVTVVAPDPCKSKSGSGGGG